MRVFCDTSVLVAAVVARHPHFDRARPLLERVAAREMEAWTSAHALGECFSVLTSLPLTPRISPSEARRILDHTIKPNVHCAAADENLYTKAVERCERAGAHGGAVYDALMIECALANDCERIFTFNIKHFQRLAPDLSVGITAP